MTDLCQPVHIFEGNTLWKSEIQVQVMCKNPSSLGASLGSSSLWKEKGCSLEEKLLSIGA